MFKKDCIIGLDIGSSSIKLAQFMKTQGGLRLIRADLQEIGYTGDEASRENKMHGLLKNMVSKADVAGSKFIVTVNCPKTAIKKVIAPYMPMTEFREAIRLAAGNYFPFSMNDALLDFEILGEILEKGVKEYQVLVATSPRRTINKYVSLLGSVGIRPALFIPIPYALQKWLQVVSPGEAGTRCFLDIGMYNTEFTIFKENDLVFSRKIPVAGNDLTKEMTGVLLSDKGRTGLSLEEAEKIKIEVGIPDEGRSEMIAGKISTTQILSMIRTPLEHLVSEIDRGFDYYREEGEGGKIGSITLMGGGSSLKGLTDFLSRELGTEARLANPLEGLKIESGAIDGTFSAAHRLAPAIGAALSEAKGLNLLPPEIKEETRRTFKRAGLKAIVTGTIFALALVYIGMRIQLASFQKRAAAGRTEMLSLQPQIEQVKTQALINEILLDEPYWEDVFKELSNIVPGKMYLTEFAMKDKTIKMRGVVTSGEPEELLSTLMLAMEKGMFNNVKLIGTKKIGDSPGNEFEIGCRVD